MSHKPHERDEEQVGDRILSDFTTQPETAGYTHGTWAMAVIFVGIALVAAPILFPWYLSIPSMLAVVGVIAFVFSATPPHLSPGQFVRYRIQHLVSQQVFVRKASNASVYRYHQRRSDSSTDAVVGSRSVTETETETETNTESRSGVATSEVADG